MKDIRIALRDYIADKGIKQTFISAKTDIKQDKISSILNLKRDLKANELLNICNALEIPVDELKKYESKSAS